MKRVLLTGAAGFVGSHCLEHFLINTDWHIVCPVTMRHKGDVQRFDFAAFDPGRVTVITHDLAWPISFREAAAIGAIDYVFHLAADSHVERSIADPVPFVDNNVKATQHLLEWARQAKPYAFYQFSTDEVYGPALDGTRHAEWSPVIPSNPYAASKACQEAIAIAYWRTYGVPLVICNSMNLIGERQDAEKFVPLVISRVTAGEVVPIHGNPATGETGSRFYIHARNCADALLYLVNWSLPARYPLVDRPSRFNIVGEREITNLEMAQMIAGCVGRPLRSEIIDVHAARPGHDRRYALDGSKLAALGWRPAVSLDDSLRRVVDWTLARQEWLVPA